MIPNVGRSTGSYTDRWPETVSYTHLFLSAQVKRLFPYPKLSRKRLLEKISSLAKALSLIHICDWRGLLRLVENDPGMPGKSETVELLQGIVSEEMCIRDSL